MAITPDHITLTVDPLFSGLYVLQRDFQARLHGVIPADLPDDAKKAYIREQALALADEKHEALAEVAWKSWASGPFWINREAYKGELADTLIFLMNLMLVAEITPSELLEVVKAKQIKNHKRQDEGYDGVSTKCPGCKRAYDDDAVDCHPAGKEAIDSRAWCSVAQEYLS